MHLCRLPWDSPFPWRTRYPPPGRPAREWLPSSSFCEFSCFSRVFAEPDTATRIAHERCRSEFIPTFLIGPQSDRSEEHTSELQSRENLVCRLLLEKKKKQISTE